MILQGLFKSIALHIYGIRNDRDSNSNRIMLVDKNFSNVFKLPAVSVLDKINVGFFQIEYTESVKPYFDL